MADEFNGEVVDLYIEHSFHTEFNKDCSECAKENDVIQEHLAHEEAKKNCDHICSGNCRRVGCNCDCGTEFHLED